MPDNNQPQVLKLLEQLRDSRSDEPLKKLFWEVLNYDRSNETLTQRVWTDAAKAVLDEPPKLFATAGSGDDFHVIYCRLKSDKLLLGPERLVINQLLKEHQYALFIFSTKDLDAWHFVNVKLDRKDQEASKRRVFRRITIGKYERLRTASQRIAMLDAEATERDMFGVSPLQLQYKHDLAFDVQKVTELFFEEYKKLFKSLEATFFKQSKDKRHAHDYALQFLNRVMFLYYVQRKRWIGDETEFLNIFWQSYRKTKQPKDTFFEKWLSVLFFEAFNGKSVAHYKHFPEDVKSSLMFAPFLNGGLFLPNDLDKTHDYLVTDNQFEEVFNFHEQYNFTITEDSPLDVEVAVDPEMIGKVYESLVNVSEELDERGDAGIFYTARIEIDLMCRLALVDNLANHLGEEHKNLFYEVVFALDDEARDAADKACAEAGLWEGVQDHLQQITVLDPACGSGSFLVGMLIILNDLLERAEKQFGKVDDSFDRKKRIIGKSLYGVDVMEWACHVAELRLWLSLIVDAEFDKMQLQNMKMEGKPMLPHFSFKIRPGDSLVQEVAGIDLGHIKTATTDKELKRRINDLMQEKLKFYNNSPNRKYADEKQLKDEERKLFKDLLSSVVKDNDEEIKKRQSWIKNPDGSQMTLDGLSDRSKQLDIEIARWQKEITDLQRKSDEAKQVNIALTKNSLPPFVWDVAFVEIFSGEDQGFDIVIGNPPYVRQELIANPAIQRQDVSGQNKKEYKERLIKSVYQKYPWYFGDDLNAIRNRLDAKSDLYVYFYFHGLSWLNPKGSFCFITSNSWLDINFGKDLQLFTSNNCRMQLIFDNQLKRSFANADINTIIVLFNAPSSDKTNALINKVRFIMFAEAYENVIDPVLMQEISEALERTSLPEYRIHPIKQRDLLKHWLDSDHRLSDTKYLGDKWGGKYLRAPDIFHKLIDISSIHFRALNDLGKVRYPIKTGVNEFFYLDRDRIEEFNIEEEFLRLVLKSPKEVSRIQVHEDDLSTYLFTCQLSPTELKRGKYNGALQYIDWGSKQKTKSRQKSSGGVPWPKAPSVKGRAYWYSIPPLETAHTFCNRFFNDRFFFAFANFPVIEDQTFYGCTFTGMSELDVSCQIAIMNTTLQALFVEVLGRVGLGEGVLQYATYEMGQLLTVTNDVFDHNEKMEFVKLFKDIALEHIGSVFENVNNDGIRNFDRFLFRKLGLSLSDQDNLYNSIENLVADRLRKAASTKQNNFN